jgi:hypothetical protein
VGRPSCVSNWSPSASLHLSIEFRIELSMCVLTKPYQATFRSDLYRLLVFTFIYEPAAGR